MLKNLWRVIVGDKRDEDFNPSLDMPPVAKSDAAPEPARDIAEQAGFPSATQIDAGELKALLDRDAVVLVDVRSDQEREEEFIPGTVHIPVQEFEQRWTELEQYKDREIVLHCLSGMRSDYARQFLKRKGFERVRNWPGSVSDWEELGNRVERK
ncbi:rhodanese-like domain-containing protein [bacterium]|nr:rhodanese-like domain-containing protein [bacterium]